MAKILKRARILKKGKKFNNNNCDWILENHPYGCK